MVILTKRDYDALVSIVAGLWDVRWAFENHWGQHALACLRPLHQLRTYGVV